MEQTLAQGSALMRTGKPQNQSFHACPLVCPLHCFSIVDPHLGLLVKAGPWLAWEGLTLHTFEQSTGKAQIVCVCVCATAPASAMLLFSYRSGCAVPVTSQPQNTQLLLVVVHPRLAYTECLGN